MKKLRVLQFAPNYLPATRYGGPIQSSHGLAKALVQRGHDVHVLTTNVDGPDVLDVPLGRAIARDGVKIWYFPVRKPRRFYFSPELGNCADAQLQGFDIAHINGMYLWPGPKVARSAFKFNVPYVISPRGMLVPELIAGKSAVAKRAWIALIERRSLGRASAIHVTSEEERGGLEALELDLAPVALIGNGVEWPSDAPSRGAIERVWAGIPSGSRVAFLGRLDWTKGVDIAIDATLGHPHAQIVIAGPDQHGMRAQLEARLVLSGAMNKQRCRFIGAVSGEQKWALIAGADVLLAPSLKESFGIAVAEALIMGIPVVCTEGVGLAPVVRRADTGCVVARNSGALTRVLTELLDDPKRRREFGQRASDLMKAKYTWPVIASEIEQLYLDSIERTSKGIRHAA